LLISTRRYDGIRRAWTQARPIERVCYWLGAILAVAGLFHLVVFAVDGGPWYGPVSWRKPVTFGLSFGLTLITVAWVASYSAAERAHAQPAVGCVRG